MEEVTASHIHTFMPPSHNVPGTSPNTLINMASHATFMPPSHIVPSTSTNTMNDMVFPSVNDESPQLIMWGACTSLIVLMVILTAVLLRYMCRHNGSYNTHEPKDEENPKAELQDSSDEDEAEPREQEESGSSSGLAFQDDTPEDV